MSNNSIEDTNTAVDSNLHVLMGHDLKSFLNSGLITDGNISSLLKQNGVYVPTKNSQTIPILSSMLLSPEIFHQMLTYVVNKEKRPKYRTGNVELSLQGKEEWKEQLQNYLDNAESIDISDINGSIEYEKLPTLVIEDSSAIITYELRRPGYNKDLLKRDIIVKGAVQFRVNKGVLEIISTFSSKETESLNKILIDNISKDFFNNGVTTQESITQIKFNDFTNKERIHFFNRLVAGSEVLKEGRLKELEIMLDDEESINLPNHPEVEFLKGNFKGLKTLGEAELNESFFIRKVEYYPYYFIPLMQVKYSFAYGANKGSCIVEFFFKAIRNNFLESVLDFSLEEPKYEKAVETEKVRRNIELKLNNEIQSMIEKSLKKP